MELTLKQKSYIYGLLGTDGWYNRGTICIELSKTDKDIVEKLHILLPKSSIYYRKRDTNFKENYECYRWCSNKELADILLSMGYPIEDKTNTLNIPTTEYDELSFWRGVLDGDGSYCIRKARERLQPMINLTTKSEALRNSFCNFAYKITGYTYNPQRNKRDNIYNIGITGNRAIQITKMLYNNIDETDLYIDRKYQKMKEILTFENQVPTTTEKQRYRMEDFIPYFQRDMKNKQIAEILNCSSETVGRWKKRYNQLIENEAPAKYKECGDML